MNRIVFAALMGSAALAAGAALAQQAPDFANVQIKATDLGRKTWMLEGQGGNMVAAAGDDGVILVDTEFAPLHAKIKAAIAQETDKPVKQVINTHYHGDHTGGDQAFWLEGATINAHQNVQKREADPPANALTGAKAQPVPAGGQPNRTYAGAGTVVRVKGRTARVVHMPNAHTDGDSAVWFPQANVLATGDIVSTGARYPNIDVAAGGNINGVIRAVDAYIARTNPRTKIVPGHGPLMTRADLIAYRKLMADCRERIAKLVREGKSEDEVVAMKPLADVQAKLGVNDMASANFERLIYKSLKA
jgi:glyoxylase-like metal-dependent hydrolase (beta-lactamase superfamily II)